MVLLEIEQKFTILPSLVQAFCLNKGKPRFSSIKSLGTIHINDAYFDNKESEILCKNGIWIRKRNGIWEAKSRPLVLKGENYGAASATGTVDHDNDNHCQNQKNGVSPGREIYNRTAFEEIRCPKQIQSLISSYIPNTPDSNRNFGLDVSCHFVTTRETYLVDGKFSVMLDQTSFGHATGEVEVEVELDVDATGGKEKELAIEKAHADIGEFLDRYSWFFRAGGKEEPKGKLSAYFEMFPPAWEK